MLVHTGSWFIVSSEGPFWGIESALVRYRVHLWGIESAQSFDWVKCKIVCGAPSTLMVKGWMMMTKVPTIGAQSLAQTVTHPCDDHARSCLTMAWRASALTVCHWLPLKLKAMISPAIQVIPYPLIGRVKTQVVNSKWYRAPDHSDRQACRYHRNFAWKVWMNLFRYRCVINFCVCVEYASAMILTREIFVCSSYVAVILYDLFQLSLDGSCFF